MPEDQLWRVIGPAALGLLIVREFLTYLRSRDSATTDGSQRTQMLQELLQQVGNLDARVEGQEETLRHILTMVERVPQLDGRLIALERQLTKRGG